MSQTLDGRTQLKAMIIPAFATTIFGGVRLLIASSALHTSQTLHVSMLILIAALTVALLIASIRFAREARRAATAASPLADRRKRIIYIAAVAFECVAYIDGYNVLKAIHRLDLLVPLLAFVVGLHFLGLIPVFQTYRYIPVAVVFCLVAILAIFLPGTAPAGAFSINVRVLVVGLVCGLYMWYVALRLLLQGRRYIQGDQGRESGASVIKSF